jgi:pre-mRNA-splicing factor 18
MDFLKDLIDKKQKENKEKSEMIGQKYIKRGQLDKLEQEKYYAEQAKLDEERILKKQKISQSIIDVSLLKPKKDVAFDLNVDKAIAIKFLRERGEPILLFGETDQERVLRLKGIIEKYESNPELTLNQLFQVAEQEILSKDLLNEKLEKVQHVDTEADIDTTLISTSLLETDESKVLYLIGVYFRRLIKEWGIYLDARSDDEKRSPQGKLITATHAQSLQSMKHFFKAMRKKALPVDVIWRITEICTYLQQREYMMANDSYLRLAIGNSAWPIGVVSVCMHERPSDDKTQTTVAHALNDEKQRKYIQSIKRLMTFAQTKWPNADVSKNVG